MANPILDQIKLSGTTYDIQDSTAIHSSDGYWDSGQTTSAITAATAALAEAISEELSGKTDVSAFTAHTSDTTVHVTSAEKTTWDGKLDSSAISGYADSVKYNSTSKYVEFYHGGTGGTKVFEYDASPFLIDGMVQNVEIKDIPIEETLVFNQILEGLFKAEASSVTKTFVAEVKDSWWTSNNNNISFQLDGESGYVDVSYLNDAWQINSQPYTATATSTGNTVYVTVETDMNGVMIKDEDLYTSVKAVYGSQTCLVISFNTDAGKQDINIPISEIFDASNYYTTGETDNKIAEATSGKADTSAVTAVNDVLTAHTADTTIHVTSTDKTNWNGKQDALVNQSNIKSVNGNSLLGSGDLTISTFNAEVSGTTLILG